MQIVDFFASTNQEYWLREIKKSNCIREPLLTPWVGFVYTFPDYRGKRHMGKLLEYAYSLAKAESHKHIYISTGETGLYEKYGYSFWKIMKDINGDDSEAFCDRSKEKIIQIIICLPMK